MNFTSFKKQLSLVLTSVGFIKNGNKLKRIEADVTTLVGFEKGFGNQAFILVGFWIETLGEEIAARVEQSHIYLRLERLFPDFREEIISAGAFDDEFHEQALIELERLIRTDISEKLRVMSTENALADDLENRFRHGFVTWQAREFLAKHRTSIQQSDTGLRKS